MKVGYSMDTESMTKQQLYEEVDKAIHAILVGGQSYKIGSRSLTRANITELRKLRSDLAAEIATEGKNSLLDGVSVAFFDGR
jgi:hypothetical protein